MSSYEKILEAIAGAHIEACLTKNELVKKYALGQEAGLQLAFDIFYKELMGDTSLLSLNTKQGDN